MTDPQIGQAFVYVSTIQRMTINLYGRDAAFSIGDEAVDEDAEKLDIPIHAFDLIIADECHSGYSAKELSTWRRTLDHFDGIKVGLTATPAAHTMAYFEQIAYRYDYERAVQEAPCCARLGPRESADCPRRRAGALEAPALSASSFLRLLLLLAAHSHHGPVIVMYASAKPAKVSV